MSAIFSGVTPGASAAHRRVQQCHPDATRPQLGLPKRGEGYRSTFKTDEMLQGEIGLSGAAFMLPAFMLPALCQGDMTNVARKLAATGLPEART